MKMQRRLDILFIILIADQVQQLNTQQNGFKSQDKPKLNMIKTDGKKIYNVRASKPSPTLKVVSRR